MQFEFPSTMQPSTPTTSLPHSSRLLPHTTQALTATVAGHFSTYTRQVGTWGETNLAKEGDFGARETTMENKLETRWPSTTSTTTASVVVFVHPIQEGHGNDVTSPLPPPLKQRQCIPLDSQCDSEAGVELHPLLVCPNRAGSHWNLVQSHEWMEQAINDHWHPFKELATSPGLPSMSLVHPWLPWAITVHASGMNSGGVTVADVLMTISRNLLIPVDRTGRTRMCYLRGRRTFVGLQMSEIGGDVWELVLD